jgi:ribonuclease J
LKSSDTIILSSSPIPGNFLSVETLVNRLYKTGASIIVNSPNCKIHASGHATRTEQQLLIKLIDPKYVVPIHGECKMLRYLKQTCISTGIPKDNVMIIKNGEFLQLADHVLTRTNQFIDTTPVCVDGHKINKDFTLICKYRKQFSNDGLISIILRIDKKNKKVTENPRINAKGSFFIRSSAPLIYKILNSIKENIEAVMQKNPT